MDCFCGIDEDVIHMNLKRNAPHTESMHNHHRDSMHRQSMHKHHPPISDLAQRFKDLAEETEEFRHALYKKVELASKKKILDAGCGTGAITHDIASLTEGEIIGCILLILGLIGLGFYMDLLTIIIITLGGVLVFVEMREPGLQFFGPAGIVCLLVGTLFLLRFDPARWLISPEWYRFFMVLVLMKDNCLN